MREIKFRAWDKDENGIRSWENLTGHVYKNPKDSIFNDPDYIIMQFTGLHDKNGKEIYEGDIIRFRYSNDVKGSMKEVYWHDTGSLNWSLRDDEGLGYFMISQDKDFYEVIGNIYENPELISSPPPS